MHLGYINLFAKYHTKEVYCDFSQEKLESRSVVSLIVDG